MDWFWILISIVQVAGSAGILVYFFIVSDGRNAHPMLRRAALVAAIAGIVTGSFEAIFRSSGPGGGDDRVIVARFLTVACWAAYIWFAKVARKYPIRHA